MKSLSLSIAAIAIALSGAAQDGATDAPEELRSYTTSWEESGITFRTIMFPHEIEGCKIMVQSRKRADGSKFVEIEGPDCNCDLVVDGQEDYFLSARGYTARKLLEVCEGPAVDGSEQRFQIMRESLKERPDYSDMPGVRAY